MCSVPNSSPGGRAVARPAGREFRGGERDGDGDRPVEQLATDEMVS